MMFLPMLSYGQFDEQNFKKESTSFEKALTGIASEILPDYAPQQSKVTYLEGYGPVFTMSEVALERSANPFSQPNPATIKQNMESRQKQITEKVKELLKAKFSELKSANDGGNLTVVIYMKDSNPIYAKVPSQIVLTAHKKDAVVEVSVHEYF
jgi:hypothetical protein